MFRKPLILSADGGRLFRNGRRQLRKILLVMIAMAFFSSSALTAADLDGDVELISIDNTNKILYWLESDGPSGPWSLKVQTTADAGASWSSAQVILVIPVGIVLEDFDGIARTATGLVATFAIGVTGQNAAYVATLHSANFGVTWGPVGLPIAVAGSFIGCPTLTTEVESTVGDNVSLITNVSNGGVGRIYYVNSNDGGTTWGAMNPLATVPTICLGD